MGRGEQDESGKGRVRGGEENRGERATGDEGRGGEGRKRQEG